MTFWPWAAVASSVVVGVALAHVPYLLWTQLRALEAAWVMRPADRAPDDRASWRYRLRYRLAQSQAVAAAFVFGGHCVAYLILVGLYFGFFTWAASVVVP